MNFRLIFFILIPLLHPSQVFALRVSLSWCISIISKIYSSVYPATITQDVVPEISLVPQLVVPMGTIPTAMSTKPSLQALTNQSLWRDVWSMSMEELVILQTLLLLGLKTSIVSPFLMEITKVKTDVNFKLSFSVIYYLGLPNGHGCKCQDETCNVGICEAANSHERPSPPHLTYSDDGSITGET